jgi:hypothetical protein
VAILVNILLATAIGVITPIAAAPNPQTFTPYRNYPGEYQLSIDGNSISLGGDDETPLVMVDIRIVMEKPVKYIDTPILVKSYQNSVAVDCRNDRVFIIVGRAFSTRGNLIYTTPKPEIVNNNHESGAPTSELIQFFCPPILDRFKEPQSKINTWV